MVDHSQNDAAIQSDRNILQRLFDSTQFLLAYMDTRFNFIRVNEQYAKADNKRPEYFVGKNHFDLYPDPENEVLFRQVVETGQPVVLYAKPFIYPLNPERGTTYWDWSLIPVMDGQNCVEGLIFTLIDVTRSKQAEAYALENERLKAHFHKEQERNIFVQRIISTLSHDLRTPLAVIAQSGDTLINYHDRLTPERRLEKMEIIRREVQFALEILEDTVNLARGNLDKTAVRPARINIEALCKVSVDEVQSAETTKHLIHFINHSRMVFATVDEVLVSRILLNLLSNAIKYSPEGSEIQLELDQRDGWLILRVIDHGIGISPVDLTHIFDPFYRAKTVGSITGSGLGLSIVKDCVERHRGRISVESEVGQGTTFTVNIPLDLGFSH